MPPFSEMLNLILITSLIIFLFTLFKCYSNGIPKRIIFLFLLFTGVVSFIQSLTNHTFGDIDLFGKQDYLSSALNEQDEKETIKEFRDYYRNNFIFFDCDYSTDSVSEITDRSQLAECLHKLRDAEEDIDLIIMDIIFDQKTKFDEILSNEIQHFDSLGKIVLAKDTGDKWYNGAPAIYIPSTIEICGDVSCERKNGMVLYQHLLTEDKEPTLPYLAFMKLTKAPNLKKAMVLDNLIFSSQNGFRIYKNDFVMPHFITDIEIKGVPEVFRDSTIQNVLMPAEEKDSCRQKDIYYSLNYCREESFQEVLCDIRMRGEKKRKSKDKLNDANIIVFGSIKGKNDLHNSIYGDVHGIEFVINSFVYMKLGYLENHLSSIVLFFMLVLFTTFIYYWLKRCTEDYQFRPGSFLLFREIGYIIIKCFDEIFLIAVAILWVKLTQKTLFVTNIFFCYFIILCATKALLIVEKLHVPNHEK